MALTRSEHMRRVRGTNTKPERILRSALWRRGLRYRVHARVLSCCPDLVFTGPKLVVFIDGCFWHGCPKHYSAPRTRPAFWSRKLEENVLRDARQTRVLIASGWRVARYLAHEIWERPNEIADEIEAYVRGAREPQRNSWRVLSATPVSQSKEHQRRLCLETAKTCTQMVSRASNSVRNSQRDLTRVNHALHQ